MSESKTTAWPRGKLWQLIGGALAFLVAAGFVSYSAALSAIDSSAENQTAEKLARLVEQAEADADRIAVAATAAEDLEWTIAHSAAGAACAGTAPEGGSPLERIAIPKREGRTCADSCLYETDGSHTLCQTSVAIGGILMRKASDYGEVVAAYYNYGCSDDQRGYDELAGSTQTYAAYCCCYRPHD